MCLIWKSTAPLYLNVLLFLLFGLLYIFTFLPQWKTNKWVVCVFHLLELMCIATDFFGMFVLLMWFVWKGWCKLDGCCLLNCCWCCSFGLSLLQGCCKLLHTYYGWSWMESCRILCRFVRLALVIYAFNHVKCWWELMQVIKCVKGHARLLLTWLWPDSGCLCAWSVAAVEFIVVGHVCSCCCLLQEVSCLLVLRWVDALFNCVTSFEIDAGHSCSLVHCRSWLIVMDYCVYVLIQEIWNWHMTWMLVECVRCRFMMQTGM